MRKKTHIALAKNIALNLTYDNMPIRRKNFYIGSILPDCVPSFLIRKHNINDTFYVLDNLVKDIQRLKENSMAFWRKLGSVLHYVADYFTFPHNRIFHGNIKVHCLYEKNLKIRFQEYLKSTPYCKSIESICIQSYFELWNYLKEEHKHYLDVKNHSIENDINYIYRMCNIVFQTIFKLSHYNESYIY